MSRHLKKEEFAKIYQEYQNLSFQGAFQDIYQISSKTKNLQRNIVKVRINKIIKYKNLTKYELKKNNLLDWLLKMLKKLYPSLV